MRRRFFPITFLAFASVAVAAAPAHALDKQGSAHAGAIAGATTGFGWSGSLILGSALYNPSYAARPDNSGKALMRYAGHLDLDLIGRRLSVPLDVNMFTDGTRDGFEVLSPTEFDVITGLSSTWSAGPGAFEFGSRFEHDRPIDRGGRSQGYADVRARYLFSLAPELPKLADALANGDVSGWLTLGWFAYNPTYFARPDNTGRALFRYAAHSELSLWNDVVSLGVDATFFTDRRSNPLRPSELDLTPELIVRHGSFEGHLAYEVDRPLDRDGLVQQFVYLLLVWSYSPVHPAPAMPPPFSGRHVVPSP